MLNVDADAAENMLVSAVGHANWKFENMERVCSMSTPIVRPTSITKGVGGQTKFCGAQNTHGTPSLTFQVEHVPLEPCRKRAGCDEREKKENKEKHGVVGALYANIGRAIEAGSARAAFGAGVLGRADRPYRAARRCKARSGWYARRKCAPARRHIARARGWVSELARARSFRRTRPTHLRGLPKVPSRARHSNARLPCLSSDSDDENHGPNTHERWRNTRNCRECEDSHAATGRARQRHNDRRRSGPKHCAVNNDCASCCTIYNTIDTINDGRRVRKRSGKHSSAAKEGECHIEAGADAGRCCAAHRVIIPEHVRAGSHADVDHWEHT